MKKIKYLIKMVESCITCDYSESNIHTGSFKCIKYNLDLSKLSDNFHKDCKLPDNETIAK